MGQACNQPKSKSPHSLGQKYSLGFLGTAAEVYRSAARKRVLDALKDGPLQAGPLMAAAEIENKNAGYILLHKMVKDEEIVRLERGYYALPGDGKIGKKERSGDQSIDDTLEADNLSDLSNLSNPGGNALNKPALGPTGDSQDDFT